MCVRVVMGLGDAQKEPRETVPRCCAPAAAGPGQAAGTRPAGTLLRLRVRVVCVHETQVYSLRLVVKS